MCAPFFLDRALGTRLLERNIPDLLMPLFHAVSVQHLFVHPLTESYVQACVRKDVTSGYVFC